MNLQHSHVGQPDEALGGSDGDVSLRGSRVAFADRHCVHAIGQSASNMFLEEAGLGTSFRATNDAHWPAGNLRQQVVRHIKIVACKISLGEAAPHQAAYPDASNETLPIQLSRRQVSAHIAVCESPSRRSCARARARNAPGVLAPRALPIRRLCLPVDL